MSAWGRLQQRGSHLFHRKQFSLTPQPCFKEKHKALLEHLEWEQIFGIRINLRLGVDLGE